MEALGGLFFDEIRSYSLVLLCCLLDDYFLNYLQNVSLIPGIQSEDGLLLNPAVYPLLPFSLLFLPKPLLKFYPQG
jgi:hypothetical protein